MDQRLLNNVDGIIFRRKAGACSYDKLQEISSLDTKWNFINVQFKVWGGTWWTWKKAYNCIAIDNDSSKPMFRWVHLGLIT